MTLTYLNEPTNEQETIHLFSQVCQKHGFKLLSLQIPFPDALIEDMETKVKYRTEFEHRASSFVRHGHDSKGCDLIICWSNDLGHYEVPIIEICNWHEDISSIVLDQKDKMKLLIMFLIFLSMLYANAVLPPMSFLFQK